MATSKDESKKVMDVTKPGKPVADATSRPVIVGSGPMMKDSTMVDKTTKNQEEDFKEGAPALGSSHSEISIAPPKVDKPTTESAEVPPKTSPKAPAAEPAKEPPAEKKAASHETSTKAEGGSESAAVDAVADQANLKKQQEAETEEEKAKQEAIQKLIDEKQYFVPIGQVRRKRNAIRFLVTLLLLILVVLVVADLAIDAGVLKTNIKPVTHFFKQSS